MGFACWRGFVFFEMNACLGVEAIRLQDCFAISVPRPTRCGQLEFTLKTVFCGQKVWPFEAMHKLAQIRLYLIGTACGASLQHCCANQANKRGQPPAWRCAQILLRVWLQAAFMHPG
jgi:hypothetical protein